MGKLTDIEKKLRDEYKKNYPDFNPGDMIKVFYKIIEKERTRLHPVEGIVIKMQGGMHRRSFTVRRIAYGQAYEVTFPYYSPKIEKIDLIKKSKRRPRRSKLYYLRDRVGRKAVNA